MKQNIYIKVIKSRVVITQGNKLLIEKYTPSVSDLILSDHQWIDNIIDKYKHILDLDNNVIINRNLINYKSVDKLKPKSCKSNSFYINKL